MGRKDYLFMLVNGCGRAFNPYSVRVRIPTQAPIKELNMILRDIIIFGLFGLIVINTVFDVHFRRGIIGITGQLITTVTKVVDVVAEMKEKN